MLGTLDVSTEVAHINPGVTSGYGLFMLTSAAIDGTMGGEWCILAPDLKNYAEWSGLFMAKLSIDRQVDNVAC